MASVLIKKYGNRRLYDTGDSRYVTLDELAAKIRSGADLRVVDAQTGEDLTQTTLTQIVLETGNAAKFLPVQLLTQMIRLSDDALAEFFSRYVTGALDLYLQAKRGVQTLAGYNPLTQIPMAAGDALARMWMGGTALPRRTSSIRLVTPRHRRRIRCRHRASPRTRRSRSSNRRRSARRPSRPRRAATAARAMAAPMMSPRCAASSKSSSR